jgi:hypothetical protein
LYLSRLLLVATLCRNLFIDWSITGGQRCGHSSAAVTLVSPNHRQR